MIQGFGIAIMFDWLFVCAEGFYLAYGTDDWNGDVLKLWNYFHRAEGNGVVGAFLTLFMYIGLEGLAIFMMYNYLIFIHMNGRLIDVYSRLTAPEERFFIPHDSEVSIRYLNWVCFKANNYRSLMGETMRTAITEYEARDPCNPEDVQFTTHVVIYKVAKDKSRTLYRHFVKADTDALVELAIEKQEVKSVHTARNTSVPMSTFIAPLRSKDAPKTSLLVAPDQRRTLMKVKELSDK